MANFGVVLENGERLEARWEDWLAALLLSLTSQQREAVISTLRAIQAQQRPGNGPGLYVPQHYRLDAEPGHIGLKLGR